MEVSHNTSGVKSTNSHVNTARNLHLVYNREARATLAKDKSFIPNFDNGGGYRLKGYTHLLMAITDILLAHDGGDVFSYTAPCLFQSAKTSFKGVLNSEGQLFNSTKIAEIIAAIHLFKMEVIDPARLSDARLHLLEVLNCSRASGKFIEAESDDAREWIPNAKQTSVLGVRFSQEMIDGWKVFLAGPGYSGGEEAYSSMETQRWARHQLEKGVCGAARA